MKQQLIVITEILKIAPSYSPHKIKIRMLQELKKKKLNILRHNNRMIDRTR